MDPAALAGLCSLLVRGASPAALPAGVACPPAAAVSASQPLSSLRDLVASRGARDAIARVTLAEAGNQGDSGLAAVVYTILNRLQDGRWGRDVDAVVNARSQFEPVMRVGGDWRNLPAVSAPFQARIDTILNLALDGRLPDLTNGARFFQNAQIVAARAQAGQVSPGLVNFGGATPSAEIGAHRFYQEPGQGRGAGAASGKAAQVPKPAAAQDLMFVSDTLVERPADRSSTPMVEVPPQGDPSQALFIGQDGRVRSARN